MLTLTERKIRLLAKRSWAGTVYPAVAPLFLLALYVFVFHSVFKEQIHDYPIYVFAGLLPWTFVAQTLGDAITTLTLDADLIRRTPFRYELLPIASVTAMSLYFLFDLACFVLILACLGRLAFLPLIAIVIPVVCLYLLVTTISMFLALIDIYNRDLRRFLANLLTVWFFLVPIVYTQAQNHRLSFLRYVDPVNIIITEFRNILYYRELPPNHTMFEGIIICTALMGIALLVYRRFDDRLPREV
jgi:ABC-type polysaccharide/polyol phosphate export permease